MLSEHAIANDLNYQGYVLNLILYLFYALIAMGSSFSET
jgi:hypothetical protein